MRFWIVAAFVAIGVAASVHAQDSLHAGTYWCQVEDTGTVYAPQRCTVSRTRAGAVLFEKPGGSQRFSGLVQVMEDGSARFLGLFFCPMGACDEALNVAFVRAAANEWTLTFRAGYIVTVSRARPTRQISQ